MATEADLKKVELKVSVICCDGCKRKVKKTLYSIQGVLKIEIDPLEPKVSIFGNVDPQILIKKLHKAAGKQAQVWSQGNNNNNNNNNNNQIINSSPKKENKKIVDDDHDHQITLVQPLMSISKLSSSSIVNQEQISSHYKSNYNNGDDHDHQKMNKLPNVLQNQQLHYSLCYCMVEPCYAVATPPGHHRSPPSCFPEHHPQPPARVPLPLEATSQVGDFFNEDNAIGCYLM